MADPRLSIVDVDVFDHPARNLVPYGGSFGAAVLALEDACLSDAMGRAVILTMDEYTRLETQGREPVAWMVVTAKGEPWQANADRFAMESAAAYHNASVALDSHQPFRVVPLYEGPTVARVREWAAQPPETLNA